MNFMEQLRLIREEKSRQYEDFYEKNKLNKEEMERRAKLFQKLGNLIELNPERLAAARIVRFIKKLPRYCLEFENISPTHWETIPGIYRHRYLTDNYLLYGFDLRKIGPILGDEISIYHEFSSFSNHDLNNLKYWEVWKMKKMWDRVNPETTSGIKLKQDTEYIKSLACDMYK